MTRILLSLAASTSLIFALPARGQEAPAVSAAPAPQMGFGTWGVDVAQIDPAVRPGDDFFAMVNGKWIASSPIPAERSSYGAFAMLDENAQADVRRLVEELVKAVPAAGTAERRIIDSYQSYLDIAAIDAAGLTPARRYLDRIFAARDLRQVSALFGEPGIPSPLGAFVMIDEEQPDRYTVAFAGDGLGLPDRDYYLKTDEKSRDIQQKYREYIAFLLGKAGYADPENAASAVYNLEYGFAQAGWDRAISRNRDLTYNKVDRARLVSLAGGFPVEAMLEKSGLGAVQEFIAWQLPPDEAKKARLGLSPQDLAKLGGGIPAMFALLENTPLAIVQAWMAAHFLSGNADVLPSAIDQANFAFYGKLLNGQQEQRPRWKRAIDTVESQLGEVLGKAYVDRHFPADSKVAMNDLVLNLRKAMAEALAGNDWMSAPTKVEAQAKLEKFSTKIGYPDKFETYAGLVIQPGKPLENGIAAGHWNWQDDLAKLGGPIDRTEWHMLPQTVNAYYDSSLNEIVFPAAILQPPFFDPKADPAVNYGGIGAVIGHEIGHGFDDQGAKYDGTGLARDWWAPQDLAAFSKRGEELVAQYNRFCPLDDGKTCVNGRLTLGENIGDIAGLSLAYRAYRMSLGGKEAPVIDGLTGDQRFFLSWAQVWRVTMREAALRQRLMTDPHSPAQFRVNGAVRNIDAWYEAFGIKPGDKLHLPPEQRVRIW